jgi:hypothetical protein
MRGHIVPLNLIIFHCIMHSNRQEWFPWRLQDSALVKVTYSLLPAWFRAGKSLKYLDQHTHLSWKRLRKYPVPVSVNIMRGIFWWQRIHLFCWRPSLELKCRMFDFLSLFRTAYFLRFPSIYFLYSFLLDQLCMKSCKKQTWKSVLHWNAVLYFLFNYVRQWFSNVFLHTP